MGLFDTLVNKPGSQAKKRIGWFEKVLKDLPEADYEDLKDSEFPSTAAKIFETGDKREQFTRFAALVRVAAEKTLEQRPYDVQLRGLVALLDGMVVQMVTGEGKTLVGAMAAAGYALQGRYVHVVSVNDYLAARDAEWMRPLFELLGVSVSSIQESDDDATRREAYGAEVIYGSVQEIGFDLLRDRFVEDDADTRVPPRDVVIVDEADSVLIDEARVPLVLAGSTNVEEANFQIARFVEKLEDGVHYEVSSDHKAVSLTDEGVDLAEKTLDVELFGEDADTLAAINLALYAQALVHRDVDYLIVDGAVKLISDSRGRVAQLQRWPDGLQAAVEAKEKLETSESGEILDQMTVEEMIHGYPTVCGMTGTALAVGDDLREFYDLEIAAIEPNVPTVREDEPDRLYTFQESKERAIVDEVLDQHKRGRPILIGTRSVAESESLASRLKARGIDAEVLNAKDDSREAEIISRAGAKGAVTVSTQMAGRGTDIRLADEEVADLGGLLVIGAGRYPSSRLDDQLRGRAGRQGDPGTSVFFTSLEDSLLDRVPDAQRFVEDGDETGFIDSKRAAQMVEHAQRIAEGENTAIHRDTWRFNELMAKQRQLVLQRRVKVREGHGVDEVKECLDEEFTKRHSDLDDAIVDQAITSVLLFKIDERWVDHLAYLNDLREGIHLRTLAREKPHEAFNSESVRVFSSFWDDVVDGSVEVLNDVTITKQGVDLDTYGLKRPSSTWTYLAAESTFGSDVENIVKRVRK